MKSRRRSFGIGFIVILGTFALAAPASVAAQEQAGPPIYVKPGVYVVPVVLRAEPSAASHVNLNVNVLGALQFGLTPAIEFGSRVSGLLRARFMNTGALSYVVFPDASSDETFAYGFGFAAGLRWYTAESGNMRGFYVGGTLEYALARVEDRLVDREAYDTMGVIPQLELGYRWAFGSVLFGVGGSLGYLVVVSATTVDLSNGQDPLLYANTARSTVYGMLALELGFFL